METEPITICSREDYLQILSEIADFWGSDRTLSFHHPIFIHEFGDTAFVIRKEGKVIAYLFGCLSQTENAGYVHLVGVRKNFQNKGLGKCLYNHFITLLKSKNIRELKAITTPTNKVSILFHTRIGMTATGTKNETGIPIVKNYSGSGQDRIVFRMKLQ